MTSLKGHLLVATPELLAPIFTRSVILMLDHSEEGAAGLVINRPTEATVATVAEEVFDEASDWDKPILLGGPVPGPLIVVHAAEEFADQEVLAGVYSTVDAAKVRDLVRARTEPALAVANYSGWAPGQLENEIKTGSWLSLPARASLVFDDGGRDDLWKTLTRELNARKLTGLLGLREVPDDPRSN